MGILFRIYQPIKDSIANINCTALLFRKIFTTISNWRLTRRSRTVRRWFTIHYVCLVTRSTRYRRTILIVSSADWEIVAIKNETNITFALPAAFLSAARKTYEWDMCACSTYVIRSWKVNSERVCDLRR